jgi:predicted HicB family RNase H-like nuclease
MAEPGRPKEYAEDRVTTAIRLPKDLYKRLKHEAIDREVSVNSLIEQATQTFLGEEVGAGQQETSYG